MGKWQNFKEKIRKQREEEHKMHEEYRIQHREFHKQQHELQKRFRELHKNKAELHKYHNHVKFAPIIILVVNLVIWYLLFKYTGIKALSIFFALLIGIGGMFQFFFLRKIENRILKPIDKLRDAVEEITKGNYNVKVESNVTNELNLLVDSFNDMAQKLQESERVKAEYEENRKLLIANISHDLKTPITSIQGYIEAITEGNAVTQENINKYLKIIYNNSEYINKLVDDLFLFSKLDMQKLEFHFTKLQVKPFFNDLMEEFKLEFEEKEFKFIYLDKIEKDVYVNIDIKRMHQVLKNIIGNAVKYGSPQNLYIRTELYSEDGFIGIDIRDNGPGISADKLPHVFDRFYRIDTERTKDFMSTGLGLAISKELVEAHGGRIEVASVENEGSCFTILLPVVG